MSVITAFAVVLAIVFGFTQNMLFSRTYRKEAAKEVKGKGEAIEAQIKGLPVEFGGNYSAYLRVLARTYDVSLYLLNEQGDVLYPREEGFDPNAPEIQETLDFSKVMEEMLQKMEREKQATVVYEGDGEYVYGSKVVLPGDAETYLYVGKSLELINTVNAQIGVRMTLLAVFIIVLAFALSSAVSGWLTRPLQEITEKAQRLGKGDFNVDFHGADYAEEIVELADTLNYARDELAKTDGMQKELIANVSHDFKTPLTMIKAYASMIQEISGDIPEKRNKHAQVIVEEADRLTSLVEDVLDLSKIRSGIETLKTEKLDMSAYLYEILARFDYLKETKNYRFVTDIEEGLCACADKLKIGQVLYNLIGNAVNYTGDDAVVYVSLKKKSEQEFVFSVRDTGKGIKQEELASVWDRYYRSSEMHKRPVKGTGLGLSIVKTVLEKHKFPFGVESTVGKGSTFYVIFPLSADVKEETDS
ncbi:MAG: HAMP domain-containing histidine kinase [Clostridia bacterium]|nr:HAMP domain-containing histidine kinase [Clostridia bacterium]